MNRDAAAPTAAAPDARPEERLSLAFELFTTSQRLGSVLESAFSPLGIRPADYAIWSLMIEVGAVPPTRLARMLGMPLTTLMDHLRRYEGRGLVARVPNPDDRRSYRVELTPEACRLHRAAGPLFNAAMSRIELNLATDPLVVRQAIRAFDDALRHVLAEDVVVPFPEPAGDGGGRNVDARRR